MTKKRPKKPVTKVVEIEADMKSRNEPGYMNIINQVAKAEMPKTLLDKTRGVRVVTRAGTFVKPNRSEFVKKKSWVLTGWSKVVHHSNIYTDVDETSMKIKPLGGIDGQIDDTKVETEGGELTSAKANKVIVPTEENIGILDGKEDGEKAGKETTETVIIDGEVYLKTGETKKK